MQTQLQTLLKAYNELQKCSDISLVQLPTAGTTIRKTSNNLVCPIQPHTIRKSTNSSASRNIPVIANQKPVKNPNIPVDTKSRPHRSSALKPAEWFHCDHCADKKFKTKNTIITHLRNQHKMAKNVYPCPYEKCVRMITKFGLRQHLINHDSKLKRQQMNRNRRTAELTKRTFVCAYCGKIFNSR